MTIESVKLNMPTRCLLSKSGVTLPHSKAINVWSDDLTIITRGSRYRAADICVKLGEG